MKSALLTTIFSVLTIASINSSAAMTRGMVAQTVNTYSLTSEDANRSGATMGDLLQNAGAKVSTFEQYGFSEIAVYNVICISKRSGATSCQFLDLANGKSLRASAKDAGQMVELLQGAGVKVQRGAMGFTMALKQIDCKKSLSTNIVSCVIQQSK